MFNTPPPPQIVVSAPVVVTGDSIASGIGYRGERGNDMSDAQWGRSPSSQYHLMTLRGSQYFSGRDVVLSTGILNHEDWESVKRQFQFLSNSAPNQVKIVGTPFARYNSRLLELCSEYNFIFLGGYTPGPDGIHPSSYNDLYPDHLRNLI